MNRTTSEINVALRKADLNRGSMYASNSSLTSSESTTTPSGTYRKKKPAPQPPAAKELFPSDQRESPVFKSNNTLSSYHVCFKIISFFNSISLPTISILIEIKLILYMYKSREGKELFIIFYSLS